MSNLFRGRSSGGAALERDLASLEAQAKAASSGYETQFLNRAGNLCVEAGQLPRALGFFGRAIDAYLESGRFSAAEVLCRKVLQISPDAVRARCTLAWLAIGRGYLAAAHAEIAGYVAAAERAGQQTLAARQLRMMADAAVEVELREDIGRHLMQLEATSDSEAVFAAVYQELNGVRATPVADEGKLWGKLLRAALMGPKELMQADREADEDHHALPSLFREDTR